MSSRLVLWYAIPFNLFTILILINAIYSHWMFILLFLAMLVGTASMWLFYFMVRNAERLDMGEGVHPPKRRKGKNV